MKTIAALFLALLLAVMAYGIFWLICLAYTTDQMRDAVHEALQADMSYGTPQWVPDPSHVTMDLPAVKIVMSDGPIREIRAPSLRLVCGFLMRDRWTMQLPQRVEVLLASGKTALLETQNGQVMWMKDGNRLNLRAASVRLLDLNGGELLKIGDVMLERKASDEGVRLSLASRVQMATGETVLSGQVVLPTDAFSRVVNLFGNSALPTTGDTLHAVFDSMKQRGGTLKMENVSFKLPNGTSGAVFGNLNVLGDGSLTGDFAITADSPAHMLAWVQQAGLLMPRTAIERGGVSRFSSGLAASRATTRMENMQSTLTLNGSPVGPLPNASLVVSRLWP